MLDKNPNFCYKYIQEDLRPMYKKIFKLFFYKLTTLILGLFLIFVIRQGFSVTVNESAGVVTINNGHLALSLTLSNGTWSGTLDGTNMLSNLQASLSSGGSTTGGFSGWTQSDLNDGIGTGKEVTFTLNGGGSLIIRMYDNDYFFTANLSKSGASGTFNIQGNILNGAPGNPMVWYTPLDSTNDGINQRPRQGPLGTGNPGISSRFAAACGDAANTVGLIIGSVGIETVEQRAEITRISNGLSFRGYCNVSQNKGQPYAVFATYDVPKSMEKWAQIIQVYNQITFSTWIPCGFCTWDAYGDGVTQSQVQTATDNLASILKPYGYTLVQIDDGWQYGVRCSGSWWANDRFGNDTGENDTTPGMKVVADYIHSKGLKAGLWIGPFEDADNPDWRGTCWGYQHPEFTTPAPSGCNGTQAYDLYDTDFLNWVGALTGKITNDWGYDYIKFDFLSWSGNGNATQRRTAYSTMRSGSKPGSYFLFSNAYQWSTPKTIDAIRAGDDVGVNFDYTQSYSVQGAIRSVSLQWYAHNKLWITDIDQIHVRNPLTDGESRIWASMGGLSGGLILTGDQFWNTSSVPSNRLTMLKKIAPSLGIAARPVDLFEHNTNNNDYPVFFVTELERPWGNYYILQVINWSTSQTTKTVDFAKRLGVSSSQSLLVYDFWNDTFKGVQTGSMNLTIPGHDLFVLSIIPRGSIPQIMATNRHISCGGIDLQNVTWNGTSRQLTGTSVNLVPNDQYTIVLYPAGYTVQSANAGGTNMTITNSPDGAIRVSYTPTTTSVNWTITFQGGTIDTTPPAAVNNLTTSNPTSTSITLTWTAPGDDGNTGTAKEYDIRYSLNSITNDTAFNNAIQCSNEPTPAPAGTQQSFTVSNLNPDTVYYFALKTADEVYNWSSLSNCPSAKTSAGGTVATKILLSADPMTILPDGVSTSTITAQVCDSGGILVPTSTATITFSRTGVNGTLIGQNPVQAVGGIAKIVFRAGTTGGTATITGTSPGLSQGSVNVTLSTNRPPNAPTNTKFTGYSDFSWTFSDPDTGDAQSAYQLLLADSLSNINSNNGNIMDTNKVISNSNSFRYVGETLSDTVTYYWKVRTWDNSDAVGPYSAVASFNLKDAPILSVSTTTLYFSDVPINQQVSLTFDITNTGKGTLNGMITSEKDWIIVDPPSFNTNQVQVTVIVDNSILNQSEGEYTGTITIVSNGGTKTISVIVTATCVLVKPNPYNPNKGLLTFFGDGVVPGQTTIKIYTLSGELVKDLSAKTDELVWDGKTENGSQITNGIYLYTYESPKEKGIGKFTVIVK